MMTASTALSIASLYKVLQRTLMKENVGNIIFKLREFMAFKKLTEPLPTIILSLTKNNKYYSQARLEILLLLIDCLCRCT